MPPCLCKSSLCLVCSSYWLKHDFLCEVFINPSSTLFSTSILDEFIERLFKYHFLRLTFHKTLNSHCFLRTRYKAFFHLYILNTKHRARTGTALTFVEKKTNAREKNCVVQCSFTKLI